jgi:predicted lipoprotein with Yx(FWY)xxD motif
MSSRFARPTRARSPLVFLAGLALLLGACTSTGSSTAASAGTESMGTESMGTESMGTESAPASMAMGSAIQVADTDLGQILTDADGLTIYHFANDSEGVSNCADDCLANWPPVEVSGSAEAGDGVTAELGTFTRDDGTTQLTVNGFPAYYFAGDAAAGDTNGQGVNDVWWVFGADGTPIES